MRWSSNKKIKKVGDIRIVKKFLFSPKTINRETRWLETAKIEERLVEVDIMSGMSDFYWREVDWVN